jgi:hypothetical protein
MKVRAIFESGTTRVVLSAENEAEMKMLGVLGSDLRATVEAQQEGHFSYGKVRSIEVTLETAEPPPASSYVEPQ